MYQQTIVVMTVSLSTSPAAWSKEPLGGRGEHTLQLLDRGAGSLTPFLATRLISRKTHNTLLLGVMNSCQSLSKNISGISCSTQFVSSKNSTKSGPVVSNSQATPNGKLQFCPHFSFTFLEIFLSIFLNLTSSLPRYDTCRNNWIYFPVLIRISVVQMQSHCLARSVLGFDLGRVDGWHPRIAMNLGSYWSLVVILTYKANKSQETRHSDQKLPLYWLDDFNLFLRTNTNKASRSLVSHVPQWAIEPNDDDYYSCFCQWYCRLLLIKSSIPGYSVPFFSSRELFHDSKDWVFLCFNVICPFTALRSLWKGPYILMTLGQRAWTVYIREYICT